MKAFNLIMQTQQRNFKGMLHYVRKWNEIWLKVRNTIFLYIIQWNSVITNSVVNEHSVIKARFIGKIGRFRLQNNPVISDRQKTYLRLIQHFIDC